MATELSLKVNPKSLHKFQFALNEFRMMAGLSMRDAFLREAGFCCYEFMRYTPPMPKGGGKGLSGSAKKAGEGATAADILSMFVTNNDPSTAFAYMVEAVVNGDHGEFNKYHALAKSSIRTREDGTYYKKRGRDARGIFLQILLDDNLTRAFQKFKNRFGGSKASPPQKTSDLRGTHRNALRQFHGNILKNGGPDAVFSVDKQALDKFIKERQKMVGYVKAGWANTLYSLPPAKVQDGVQYASRNKVPAWVKRHANNNQGYYDFNGNQNSGNFNLIIGNNVGDNDGVATSASTINYVLQVRANKLDREVMRRLGKYIKAFNAQY